MKAHSKPAGSGTAIMLACVLLSATVLRGQANDANPRSWMKDVRIGAYGLSSSNAAEIVRKANSSDVYGIEVDNDIPGRYESFVDPTAKLQAI